MASSVPGQLYDETGTIIPASSPPPSPTFDPAVIEAVGHDARDRFRLYPSRNLTPNKIAAILELADIGDLFEWAQLCEEVIEKDPKIGSVLQTRVAAVLGTEHSVAPAELDEVDAAQQPLAEEIAKFCQSAFERSNGDTLIADILDSIGKPLAVDWIDWGYDDQNKIVPKRFRRIPTTHLRWSWREDVIRIWNPHGWNQIYPATSSQVQTSYGYGGANIAEFGFPPEPYTTVRAIALQRRDHPTRAGLLRTLVWYWFFKTTAMKDWLIYGERYGMPFRILKMDPSEFKIPEMYAAARNALRVMGPDMSAVISKNTELTIEGSGGKADTQVFQQMIAYYDTAIAQAVLGHELSSQGSRGSGNLGISAAQQVRQDILEGDCTFVAETIKRDVLTPLVGWNYGWDKVNLIPELEFDFEPPRDLASAASVMAIVAKTFPALQFSEQQIRSDYGFDKPLEGAVGDDDETDALLPGERPAGDLMPDPSVEQDLSGLPSTAPAIPMGSPDITIQSVTDGLNTLAEDFTAFAAARRNAGADQTQIDKLAARGSRLAATKVGEWRKHLNDLVTQGAADGITFQEMSARLVEAFPKLDSSGVEKALREQLTLARLFGRKK